MKIGIVGAGQVGATAAYSMMMRRVGSEIMLVDEHGSGGRTGARHSGRYAFRRSRPGPRGRVRRSSWRAFSCLRRTDQRPGRAGWICSRATPRSSQRSCRQYLGWLRRIQSFSVATNRSRWMTIVTVIAGRGGVGPTGDRIRHDPRTRHGSARSSPRISE